MSKVFFISDLHFNHKNILMYEPSRIEMTRDFYGSKYGNLTVEEITELYAKDENFRNEYLRDHDMAIVSKWNDVVGDDDIVWVLGDVGIGPAEVVGNYVRLLKGHKRLVCGNHDKLTISDYYDMGFEFISIYLVVLENWFELSHRPAPYINGNYPFFNIYGHVHGDERYPTHTEHSQCVCVERNNFAPVEITEYDNYIKAEA